jgi:hypothetical protein
VVVDGALHPLGKVFVSRGLVFNLFVNPQNALRKSSKVRDTGHVETFFSYLPPCVWRHSSPTFLLACGDAGISHTTPAHYRLKRLSMHATTFW